VGGGGTGTLTVPIFGVADAPVAAVSPGVASVFNIGTTALPLPFQAAVDGAGRVYVSSYTGNEVVAFPAGGGSGTPVDTGSVTLFEPAGVALDGAGNLFIADHGNSRIVKVATSGTASVFAISGLSTPISLPTALAFDGAGNLYITDYGVGRIVEVNPAGQGTVLATGSFTFVPVNITGAAVDAFGNVYIADHLNNRILKVDPLGNTTIVSVSSAGTLSGPQGVAVDGSGNLYIVDSGHQRIIQLTTAGVASVMQFAGATLGPTIFGTTVDPSGNLLISDWTSNRLVKVNVGQSALAFAGTQVGSAGSDSPKTLTVTNSGDMPLIFPIPAAGNDPAIAPGFVLQNSSTCPQLTQLSSSAGTLPAGNQCTLSLSFIPTAAGSTSGSLVITNNSLNAVGPGYASQTAALSGVATQAQSVVTWGAPDAITYGTALSPTQLNATSGAVAGTFTYSPAAGTILTAGTHTLSVTFTPTDTNGHGPATATTTITVNRATGSVAFSSSGTGQPGSPLTLTATVTATYATPTGTVQFLAGATVLGSAPLDASGVATSSTSTLPAGGGTLTAQYSGDANYSASMADTNLAASFSIATTAPELSVQLPGSGSVPLTFTPMGGFAGTVTLSCSGLPPSLACNFNPQVFVADGSDQAQTSELTISTKQSGAIVGLLLLPGMAIGGLFSRRRREPGRKASRAAIVAGLIAVFGAALGCSSGHVQNTQTYDVAVTAVVSRANGYQGPPTQIAMLTVTLAN
jgi:sugar lactone lactonase YvrE